MLHCHVIYIKCLYVCILHISSGVCLNRLFCVCRQNENIYVANLCGPTLFLFFLVIFGPRFSVFRDLFVLSAYPAAIFFLLLPARRFVLAAVNVEDERLSCIHKYIYISL